MSREQTYAMLAGLSGVLASALLLWCAWGAFDYAYPWVFWFGALLLVQAGLYVGGIEKRLGKVRHAGGQLWQHLPESPLGPLRHLLLPLRMAALALLVIVIARPQSNEEYVNQTQEGIDIVLAMDISTSMLARDFKPNRLMSAKKLAADFVAGRTNDRIGVVVYEGESFTHVPLTSDHRVVRSALSTLEAGIIEDGTAIGIGLATAVNRLKDSDATSKVVILLTDGENNAGQIKPLDAARLAEAFDIRVYAIGVGSKGQAPIPRYNPYIGKEEIVYIESRIDDETLQAIADMTGGAYYRATSDRKLQEIYSEIDLLEKTRFNVTQFSHKTEEFKPYLMCALMVIGLEFLMRHTLFRFTG